MGFGFSETLAEDQSVAANTLRFGPVRQDVEWDSESFASVTITPRCVNTSATHTVSVVQVFTADHTYLLGVNQTPLLALAGDSVVYRNSDGNTTGEIVFSLTPTVSSTGNVTFSLSESTAWTDVPAGSNQPPQFINTARPRFFQYRVDADNGTAKTVLAVGLVSSLPVNVIQRSAVVAAGSGTAQQCPT
jgi:hypothetical protein